MPRKRRKFIELLGAGLILCCACAVVAFGERLPIRVFTTADGLGSSFVDGIFRDSRGFVWFATRERVAQLSNLAGLPPLPPAPVFGATVPGNLQGGYGRSLGNLFGQNYPTFRVGVRLESPLGNRAARAELGRARTEDTRLEYERRQLEQIVTAEVRNAVQALTSAESRLAAAVEARAAAEKQFDSERRQFINAPALLFSFWNAKPLSSPRRDANSKPKRGSTKPPRRSTARPGKRSMSAASFWRIKFARKTLR